MAAQRVVIWFGVLAVFVLLGGLLWLVYDSMSAGDGEADLGDPRRTAVRSEPEKAPAAPRGEEGPVNPFKRSAPTPRRTETSQLSDPVPAPTRSAAESMPITSFGVLDDYLLSTKMPTVYGVVADENGPVKGAFVVLYRDYPKPLDYPRVAVIRSDEQGQFVFAHELLMPNTQYHVHVMAPGKASRFYWKLMRGKRLDVQLIDGQPLEGQVLDGEGEGVAEAKVVGQGASWREVARAGKDGRFEFPAAPTGESLKLTASAFTFEPGGVENASAGGGKVEIRLTAGVPVTGRVVDGVTDEPLNGVTISIGLPGLPERVAVAQTDEEGSYRIPGLPATFTTFFAALDGYSEAMVNTKIAKSSATVTHNFKLFPSGRVSGRVVDASGNSVAGARVYIALKNVFVYYVPDPNLPDATTDEDGMFLITGVGTNPNADCKLSADHPEYMRGESGVLRPKPGQTLEGVVIKLADGLAFGGTVKRQDGRGISGAEIKVTAFGNQVIGNVLFGSALVNTPVTTTDEEGKFIFHRLTPGRARLDISATDFIAVQEMIEIPKEGIRDKVVTLEPGFSIAGRVLDNAGSGIPGARVHAASPHPVNSYSNALTNQEGYFKVANLKQGVFTITVRATGYADGSREGVQVGETKADFSLAANGKVSGRVSSAVTGAPAKDFVVNLMLRRPNGTYQWYRDFRQNSEDGRYTCEDVQPGTYKVSIRAADHAMQSREGVAVMSGAEAKGIDFVLTAGGAIFGKVTDRRGGPIKGAHVVATPIDYNGRPSSQGQSLTDSVKADGSYRIRGLMAGTYEVKPFAGGFCQSRGRRVRVAGEQAYPLDLFLCKGGFLRVDVTGSDGKPVAGAQIRVVDANGAVYGGTPDGGGIAGAAAGAMHGDLSGGVAPEGGMEGSDVTGAGDRGLRTGQGGSFRLGQPIAPGSATVVVTAPGYKKKQSSVMIQDEAEAGLRVVLRK